MNRFRTTITCALLLASAAVCAADAPGAVDPEKHLADLLVAEGAVHLEHRFRNSGLADEDIARTAVRITEGYARCLIGALRASELPEAQEALIMLSQGLTMEEVCDWEPGIHVIAMDTTMRSLDDQINRCVERVNQQNGVPPHLIMK